MTVVVGAPERASAAPPPWWNSSYSHRLGITVSAVDAIASGYSLSVTFDHSAMVAAGNSLANGNDVRIVYYNGSSWTELDRLLAPSSQNAYSGWNYAATKLWFRTQASIAAGASSTAYYMYFGYPSAGSPPAAGANIFDVYDDFSGGTLNASLWGTWGPAAGVTGTVTGGEYKISGTQSSAFDATGFQTNGSSYNSGYMAESNIKIVSQSSAAASSKKIAIGTNERNAWILGNDVSYLSGSSFGTTTITGTSTGYVRLGVAVDPTMARVYEDGTLVGTNLGLTPYVSSLLFYYGANAGPPQAIDVRWDDVWVRKHVPNEPTTTLEQSKDVAVSVSFPLTLTLTVNGVPALTSCGDVTTSVASTSSLIDLGKVSLVTQHPIGGQNLNIITNAANGYTIYARQSAQMTGASSGRTLANMTGTDASPATWPANGTEAFGYTTQSSTLSGTAARFHTNKWAGFTTSGTEVMRSTTAPSSSGDTQCVAVQASIAGNTPADNYSTTVSYTAVPSP